MRKDDISINEAYSRVYQRETLEEGLFDTAKAKFSGAVKGLAPMKRIGSVAAKGLGKVAGKFSPEAGEALQQAGERMQKSAAGAGKTAKINSIMDSHTGSIMKIANEIINDLNKLELNPEDITPEQFGKQMKNKLQNMLVAQLPELQMDETPVDETTPTKTADRPEVGEKLDYQGTSYYWAGNGWTMPSKSDPSKSGAYVSRKTPEGKKLSDTLTSAWQQSKA